MTTSAAEPLLAVEDLRVHFPGRRRDPAIKAVDGVSFEIEAGRTLGLVGESGCGKSTTGRAILRLIEPTSGSVRFRGKELKEMSSTQLRRTRREMQMVFQDPYSSLDSRMTVEQALAEPLRIHGLARGRSAENARIAELLDSVGMPQTAATRYPHEFSGGQRQRIAIARALAVEPKLIVADEPISALDVSVQAQVLNLFDSLQERFGIAYLFIAHDLAAVRHISHRIAVMHLGRIVEVGDREEVTGDPLHPYSRALLSAVPRIDPIAGRERIVLRGDLPSPARPPAGCHFHTRCPFARPDCATVEPALEHAADGRLVACRYWAERDELARAEVSAP